MCIAILEETRCPSYTCRSNPLTTKTILARYCDDTGKKGHAVQQEVGSIFTLATDCEDCLRRNPPVMKQKPGKEDSSQSDERHMEEGPGIRYDRPMKRSRSDKWEGRMKGKAKGRSQRIASYYLLL